jgi:membrane-associated phospholipid phosphatase
VLSLNRYRLVDFATQGYLLFVACVVLLGRGNHGWLWAGLHALALGLVHALIHFNSAPTTPRGRQWVRDFYPILLFGAFYMEILPINRMLGFPRLDPWLMRADQALFGRQVAEAFLPTFPSLVVSEVLHLSYLSFYLMIGGVGCWLALRDRRAFGHFVTVVALVFYVCYATYLFVPAAGPRLFYADTAERGLFFELYGRAPRPVPPGVEGGWCYRALDLIERHVEIPGAAFPSSHVALALITAWFSWRYVPAIRWLHLGLALLICGSTVYTRAHYGVDVLAGWVTAAVLFPLANAAYHRWGWREIGSAPSANAP